MGNKEIREKQILKKREEHLAKVAKIMTRSTPAPHLEALTHKNPRKRAVQAQKNALTERENKALLKRISNILTAPPKITDEDYLRMKSLVTSVKGNGPRQHFERKLEERRMKAFFDNIARTGAYYNPREWETDYQKQLLKQKFIRQVKYTRPKDFVDPFLKREAEEKEEKASPSRSYSHLNRVRGIRSSRADSPLSRTSREGTVSPLGPPAQATGSEDDYEDEYQDAFDAESSGVVLLTRVHRYVNVTESEDNVTMQVTMNLSCMLVEGATLVISALGDEEDGHGIEAEAEIGVNELFELRESSGLLSADVRSDPTFMKVLATELVNTLEIRIEEGVARLVLNLEAPTTSPAKPVGGSSGSKNSSPSQQDLPQDGTTAGSDDA